MITEIKVKENSKYLSDFMNELPANCVFNKGVTGCGGTTLELRANRPSIIAMPTISLINNKAESDEFKGKVLAVHSSSCTSKSDILEYIRQTNNFKILVTYDSVPKILEYLYEISYPIENIFLLVDEYHLVLNHYGFRDKAINYMLEAAKHFSKVTYMSATPMKEDFILTELKGLDVVNVIGWNTVKPNIKILQSTNTILKVTEVIKKHLENKANGNLHFFINSVTTIGKIGKKLGLNLIDNTRIICSGNEQNMFKLKKYNACFTDINSPVKKINFYTSTTFSGCDIFDETGIIYIVSDQKQGQTKHDIYTEIPQIIGRIRNQLPIFAQNVYHIVSGKPNRTLTPDEVNAEMERKKYDINLAFKDAEETIKKYKDDKQYWEDADIAKLWNTYYIQLDENNKPVINRNVLIYELYCYEIELSYIPSILISEYNINGYNSELGILETLEKWKKDSKNPGFFDMFKVYAELKEFLATAKGLLQTYQARKDIEKIEFEHPLVYEAYDLLPKDEVLKEKCLSNIKRKILAKKISTKSNVNKVFMMIKDKFHSGETYTMAKIKSELQACYNAIGVSKKAVASDIETYFSACKTYTKRINGKPTGVISIGYYKPRFDKNL
jgi:hypothetical protein